MTEAKQPCLGAVLKSIVSLKLEFLSHNKTIRRQRQGPENQAGPRSSQPRKANGLPMLLTRASSMLAHQRFSIQKKPSFSPYILWETDHQHKPVHSANSLGKFLKSSLCIGVFLPSVLSVPFSSWFPPRPRPIVHIISDTILAPSFFLKIANKKIRWAEYYYQIILLFGPMAGVSA